MPACHREFRSEASYRRIIEVLRRGNVVSRVLRISSHGASGFVGGACRGRCLARTYGPAAPRKSNCPGELSELVHRSPSGHRRPSSIDVLLDGMDAVVHSPQLRTGWRPDAELRRVNFPRHAAPRPAARLGLVRAARRVEVDAPQLRIRDATGGAQLRRDALPHPCRREGRVDRTRRRCPEWRSGTIRTDLRPGNCSSRCRVDRMSARKQRAAQAAPTNPDAPVTRMRMSPGIRHCRVVELQ